MKIEDPISRTRSPETNEVEPLKNSAEQDLLNRLSEGEIDAFWKLWQSHQNYLYHRCIGWMGGDKTEAEEALSRALLKAQDKLPKYAKKITNLRAWLTRFTHNLCVDIHRERRRKEIGIDNIEDSSIQAQYGILSSCESPESEILRNELWQFIQDAVNALPERLRIPFILRYYRQVSYSDIAQKLGISKDNAYKRIQQARDILAEDVKNYLSGTDNFKPTLSDSCDAINHFSIESEMIDASSLKDGAYQSVEVNYNLTATCLETLSHRWCLSPRIVA